MLPENIINKRILISPLNWGMGHVARCIPLIDMLLKNGNSIFIAANEDQQQIFAQYFSNLTFIDHEGYPFKFGKRGNYALDLMKQFSSLKKRMSDEFLEVENYVKEYSIDIVISDHRYGFRSESVPSIILTHQVNLPIKRFEGWVQKIHHKLLRAFDEIWVPDLTQSELSGDLSLNSDGFSVNYIGHLSRFSLYDNTQDKTIDKVIVVSGPSVYAKLFLDEQLELIKGEDNECVIVLPKEIELDSQKENIKIQRSDDWRACDQQILSAKKIISRSGYSTLMDLYELKTPFSITPTPGQREQEYLYDLWCKKALGDAASLIDNKE